ncbi:MAG TPA: GIY-YIG nuclease family protein [Patescibacteria group bacterium]|nr:GIY-YIG nuclease family protein [Patescibacteria group bacterium]
MYYFYLFRCADGSLYCGSTNNIDAREKLHNAGRGAKYTFTHGGGKMVYHEPYPTKSEALKREAAVKKWPKIKKEQLAQKLLNQS